jgi:hypothetical protein
VEKKNGEIKVIANESEITSLSLFGETPKDATGGRVQSHQIIVESGAKEIIAKI